MRANHESQIAASFAGLAMVAFLCLVFFKPPIAAGLPTQIDLSPQEARGKQIYLTGTASNGREILAYLGESSLEMPGSTLPCVNCHGRDGKGKPEGGVVPSNVTWEALTKPYGVTHASGRKHASYTERALEWAIVRGLDPAGNRLLNVMPRYQMSREDLADLIAYLRRLGGERERGVSETEITIGVVVPGQGPLAAMGQAIKAVTTAFFEGVNAQGGIYNRKVNLKFVETAGTPAGTAANVKRFIQEQQVFALSGAFIAGADSELANLMNELEVPLIGPLTLQPQLNSPLNRYVFYILSGLDGQARVLVNFAASRSSDQKAGVLIVYPDSALSENVKKAIADQCRKDGCGPVLEFGYQRQRFDADTLASNLSKTNKNVVFFLGAGAEALTLLKAAEKLNWAPFVYLPGGMSGNDLFDAPQSFRQKLFLSLPASPADQTAVAIDEFRALTTKYKLPQNNLATQLLALSAAKILLEGMKRSGRDLNVESLIDSLERLAEFPTGLAPRVSYGPNRRLGAMGGYVVAIDLEQRTLVPASPWTKID